MVLTIQPVKNLQGKFELPPSLDLFFLAVVTAIARKSPIRIEPAPKAPIIKVWENALSGLCSFTYNSDVSIDIHPIIEDPSLRISFSTTNLPWRDLTVFTLLSMRKTLVFNSISEKRIAAWKTQLARFGCKLLTTTWESSLCLSLDDTLSIPASDELFDDTDLDALLGLLLGAGLTGSYAMNSAFLSPLRSLAPILKFTLDVKSTIPKERDSLSRRIQLMQQKGRKTSNGQQFLVVADFTPLANQSPDPTPVTLPGDATIGTVFTAAKCLYPKSSFILSNMPLESWALPVLPFIRKMGCKVSVQETGRTTFGSIGIVQIQSSTMIGRKCDCKPIGRYLLSLPALIVIAAHASGESVFRGLEDLRNDTTDGIDELEACIRTLGARHGEMPDGIVLQGGSEFDGFDMIEPLPPETVAAFCIAATRCVGSSTINNDRLDEYYPQFTTYLEKYFEYRKKNEKN